MIARIFKENKFFLYKILGASCILLAFILCPIIIFYELELQECKNKRAFYPQHPNLIPLATSNLLDSLDQKKLKIGADEMAKHKLVVVGITRDNVQAIPSMIRHIEHIGELFKDYRVILFENDSKDGTKLALETWQVNNAKIEIITKDFGNEKRPSHKFMADARNYYLTMLKNQEYDDFNIIMTVDMDLGKGIDVRGIQDSFSKIEKWDAVCSNGTLDDIVMYDAFAFRNNKFPWAPRKWHEICSKNDPQDKWTEVCKEGAALSRGWLNDLIGFRGDWRGDDRLYWLLIVPQNRKIESVDSDLVTVDSCFGGLAFYKKAFIESCEYDSIDNDCEHVIFHQCLKNKHDGRMVMNPAQLIRY